MGLHSTGALASSPVISTDNTTETAPETAPAAAVEPPAVLSVTGSDAPESTPNS